MEELKKKANELIDDYANGADCSEALLERAMNIIAEFVKKA